MDSPTLRQLGYAVAVADHGHFGRAAEAEHVSQPALSDQIRELERRLGVTLFERGRHGARTTAAGDDVTAIARRILTEVADLRSVAASHHGTLRGPLRIGAIPTAAPYLLPTTVATLGALWPEATLELHERRTEQLLGDLRDGHLDLALLAIPYEVGPMRAEPLLHESFHLAVPVDHPLASVTEPVPTAVLAELEVLLLEDGHCLRRHALDACAVAGVDRRRDVRDASLATLTQMVAAGTGVTLLPASAIAVEARPGAGVVTIPFEDPAPGRTIVLAWRPADPRTGLFESASTRLADELTPPS